MLFHRILNQLFTRYPNQTAYDKSNPIITFNESIIYLYFIDVRLFVYIFPFSNACIKKICQRQKVEEISLEDMEEITFAIVLRLLFLFFEMPCLLHEQTGHYNQK